MTCVVTLFINRCDIMNLFLFGYLCFCITISLTKSSDTNTYPEISERHNFNNCTQCVIQQQSSCICFDYVDKCVICCSSVPCCVCANCATCWHEQQELILMTQIGIAMLFGLGIVGLVAFYCKMCNKAVQTSTPTQRRCVEEGDLTTYCSTIEGQERPPSYNEAVRNTSSTNAYSDSALSLYTSPSLYNRMSMSEAPPSYPGTPKLQEKILHQNSNEPPSSFPVVQHM